MWALIVAGAASGCGDDADAPGGGGGGGSEVTYPPQFEVDESLQPARDALAPLEGSAERPLARFADDRGNAVDFVENELVVVTEDAAALEGLLARWDGEVLLSTAAFHLVRIDPSAADPAGLPRDIVELDRLARGDHGFSSERGLRLFAAAAHEKNDEGLEVSPNIVLAPHEIPRRSTSEAATGSAAADGTPFSSNAADWPYMARGTVQDIGVVEAWRVLDHYGALGNQVTIGIADAGFADWGHLPVDREIHPAEAWNRQNEWACGGGNPCPWHGIHVAAAAFAVPDDGVAAAGPAGPVARARFLQSPSQDLGAIAHHVLDTIDALGDERPRIVNISAGGRVPAAGAALTNGVVDVLGTTLRGLGIAVFASAGNAGEHLDEEDCARVCLPDDWLGGGCVTECWEVATYTPCENADIICVGGLAWDSTDADPGSNWGTQDAKSVDIYGPYEVWTGPDPDNLALLETKTGTSFAAPFVAGVAGLVLAADPSLTPGELEGILESTAHTGGGPRVHRWVDAFAAVRQVYGNAPPFVEITHPLDGGTLMGGRDYTFSADVDDPDGDSHTVTWESNIDGDLGTGILNDVSGLSYGLHVFTATVTDEHGETASHSVSVEVTNEPPTLEILLPEDGETYFEGESIRFRARSSDPNEASDVSAALADSNVTWTSNQDGILGTGHRIRTTLSRNVHIITVQGTDGFGAMGQDQIPLTVAVSPTNQPPRDVRIVSPAPAPGETDPTFFVDIDVSCVDVDFEGSAVDPEGGTLTYAWSTDRSDLQDPDLGTGRTSTAALCRPRNPGCTMHDVLLAVTDDAGHTRREAITVCLYGVER